MMRAIFGLNLDIACLCLLALAGGGSAWAQELSRELGPVQRVVPTSKAGAIGLQARFDRADPSYAVGDQLSVMITTKHVAQIEVWELGADGALKKILPVRGTVLLSEPGKVLTLPSSGTRFTVEPPRGVAELHIIARAVNGAQRSIGDADTKLSGTDVRDEVRLRYRIL